MSNKPKVFISSTIYDFKDLRSSLKYYLTSMGFEAVLSESNDFIGSVGENSYDACLSTIKKCQYFILLIGSRSGGMFDKNIGISITRKEYQIAYDLLEKGEIKILTFVRRSLWDIKEERQALIKFLEKDHQADLELSDEIIKDISSHSSKFVRDSENIFSFIDEVSRKNEMYSSIKNGTTRPVGNWIYQFENFSEIIDAIRIQLNVKTTIEQLAVFENLRKETLENLRILIDKHKDGLFEGYRWFDFLDSYDLNDLGGKSVIPKDKIPRILIYTLNGFSSAERLSTRYANEAIKSGQLLSFDHQLNKFTYTDILNKIFDLIKEIERLQGLNDLINPKRLEYINIIRQEEKKHGDINIKNEFLYLMKSGHDRHKNIIILSSAIIRYIDGDSNSLTTIKLAPIAATEQQSEQISKETPTLDDLEKWINNKANHGFHEMSSLRSDTREPGR